MFNKRFCLILVLHLGFIKSKFLMLQGQKQENHCRDLHPWGRWAVHPVVTLDGDVLCVNDVTWGSRGMRAEVTSFYKRK